MLEETRITANPLAKETRITADRPSRGDTRICLNDPKEEEPKPRLLQRLERYHSPWFYISLSLVIGNTLLLLQSVHTDHNREAIMQQNDKVFRENQIEFEKEFKRRQAEIDKMQEVIDNNQKEIDKMQEVIDNRQKEIDDRQKELDRQRREDQRAK